MGAGTTTSSNWYNHLVVTKLVLPLHRAGTPQPPHHHQAGTTTSSSWYTTTTSSSPSWYYHFIKLLQPPGRHQAKLVLPLHRAGTPQPPHHHQAGTTTSSSCYNHLIITKLVLPLHRCTDVRQQRHQPVHLRRQVPRVPTRRPSFAIETETKSAALLNLPTHLK